VTLEGVGGEFCVHSLVSGQASAFSFFSFAFSLNDPDVGYSCRNHEVYDICWW